MAFVDRARFMGYAARVMRGLIIDDVRRRRSQKRGGLFAITSLRTCHVESIADQTTRSFRSATRSTSSPRSNRTSPKSST